MTGAWGIGFATTADSGSVLDTWYPAPQLGPAPADHRGSTAGTSDEGDRGDRGGGADRLVGRDDVRGVRVDRVVTAIDLSEPPRTTPDAYLRLHLLSHRLVLPNSVNLDGLFPLLPIAAWTPAGPVDPDALDSIRPALRRAGLAITGLDRFPRMLDYVVPSGVRIADAARVRLGAHLAPGTTVMHEGFVNFNAGTLGASMVEGRVSQGVVVGDGADVGGGASIMGTLSGGGTTRITIGARALLGANSGVGISIGDDSVVEAGLYVTAGTKVTLVEPASGSAARVVKASELSGIAGLLFRRNSRTGAVEALPRSGAGVDLNPVLHA